MLAHLKPIYAERERDGGPSGATIPCISTAELFGEGHLVHIRHQDTTYTLRQTRDGKLILTK